MFGSTIFTKLDIFFKFYKKKNVRVAHLSWDEEIYGIPHTGNDKFNWK